MRVRRFAVALVAASIVTHVPFVLGAIAALRGSLGLRAAVVGALGIAAALLALLPGRIEALAHDAPRSRARMLFEEAYFVHWCATVGAAPIALLVGVVAGVARLAGAGAPADAFLVGGAAYAAALVLSLWGVVVRRRWVRVRRVVVPIAGLPEAFVGYRVAHLSDLHIGSFCPRERAARWVHAVNALDVDLVALTGDYVTSGVAFHEAIADVLGAFRAKDRTVAVMGNHDYFGDGEPLVTLLRARGVEVLRNEATTLVRGGAALALAGVDDVWTRRADVAATLRDWDSALPLVVLAHDPLLFPAFAERGAALVLSGHTHWGQVAVPFLASRHNLSSIAFEFHADVHRLGDAVLYVSPGLGTTGPPVRLGAAPEITILELARKPDRSPA